MINLNVLVDTDNLAAAIAEWTYEDIRDLFEAVDLHVGDSVFTEMIRDVFVEMTEEAS